MAVPPQRYHRTGRQCNCTGPERAAVPVTVTPDGSISGSIAAPALAGSYTATATDINGNTATDTATATDSTPPAVELNVVINTDGSATSAVPPNQAPV